MKTFLPCSVPKIFLASSTATDAIGNRGRPHRGLGAHALGHGEGAGKELIQLTANRADGTGGGVGLFHLAENLGFADHHRIQARGHAEDVPHRIFFAVLVEMCIQFVRL